MKTSKRPKAHAILSASKAYQWIECTPSAVINSKIKEAPSEYAAEGTKAHEIAETFLRAYLRGDEAPKFSGADAGIVGEVYPYVDRVIREYSELKKQNSDTLMLVETQVSFDQWVPEGFGTADIIILSGKTIYVKDLKYGKGVEVSAKDNPQIRCYALGALQEFGMLYNVDTVDVEILQPRINNYSSEVMPVEYLLNWAKKVLKPAAAKAAKGEGELTAGEHCRFCKYSAQCPQRASENTAVMKVGTPEVTSLTNDQISDLLYHAEEFSSWLKSLKDYVTERLMAGESLMGWKLVEGRSIRRWTDTKAVEQALLNAGYDDSLIHKRELYGITDMTRIMGGKKKLETLLGDYIEKPAGKPTLVRDTDSRPAIGNSEIHDFDEIDAPEGAKGE